MPSADQIMELTESELADEGISLEESPPSETPSTPEASPLEDDIRDPDAHIEEVEEEEGDEDVELQAESESADGGKEGEKKEKEEVVGPTIKTIDGKEVALSTKVMKKVDGKMREVSIQEALDQYSAKYAVSERFAEANKVKQKAEHKEWTTQKLATRWIESMEKGRTRDALDAFCELTGKDAATIWPRIVEAQKQLSQQLAQLDEQGWQAYEARSDADYFQRRESWREEKQVEEALLTQKLEAQQKYDLSDEDLRYAGNFLLDTYKQNGYNKELTLEDVVSTARDFKILQDIDTTIREQYPALVGNGEVYNKVLSYSKEHGITKDQWADIIEAAQTKAKEATKVSQDLAAKKERDKRATSPKPAQRRVTKSSQQEVDEDGYLDIVDLDEF